MELSTKEYVILLALAFISGGFGLAIAFSVGYLSFRPVPKKIFWLAILIQIVLSFGLFIGTTLWFYSQLTPESLPKDFITGATLAYFASAIPELTFGILVLLLKIARKFVISSYLKKLDVSEEKKEALRQELDTMIPDLALTSITDRYEQEHNSCALPKHYVKAQRQHQKEHPKNSPSPSVKEL